MPDDLSGWTKLQVLSLARCPLSDAEQEKFYREAAAKLFNYRYDVQDAYARFLEKGINGEKGSVENGK